jgi:predicted ester cyclase
MSAEANKATERNLVAALNAGNLDELEQFCTPQYAQGLRAMVRSMPFSNHQIEITDMIAEGDKLVTVVRTSGTHTGEWEGVPATGRSWTNHGIFIGRFEGEESRTCPPFSMSSAT